MKLSLQFCLFAVLSTGVCSSARADYSANVLDEKPVAYWRFNESNGANVSNSGTIGSAAEGTAMGKLFFGQVGPRPAEFPLFESGNTAIGFNQKNGFIRVKSSPENPLAFKLGDTITLEAWVNPNSFGDGHDIYIVGKGRTGNPGFAPNNQNWGLRLRGIGGEARLSFLFRDSRNLPNDSNCWHRWVSKKGFAPGTGWHRVVVTYTFGEGDSVRGWIDAEETPGKWDYGGKTDLGPVVDADEVWIGSSQGGSANSTFNGLIDEVAIYGSAPSQKLAQRFVRNALAAPVVFVPNPNIKDSPADSVRVQIFESGIDLDPSDLVVSVGADSGDNAPAELVSESSWKNPPSQLTDEFSQRAIGFAALSTKYSNKGIKHDRSVPFLVRAATQLTLPAGEHQLLIRTRNTARLLIDGELIATTAANNVKHADNETVPDQVIKSTKGTRILPPGHNDQLAAFKSDGRTHTFVFEVFVGGKKLRPEIGETCVAILGKNGAYHLLGPKTKIALTDEEWKPYASAQTYELAERDIAQRRVVSSNEDKYWAKRHAAVCEIISSHPAPSIPPATRGLPANNAIDHFINAKLTAANASPTAPLDDAAFLRRVTLDTLGLIPTPEQIADFQNDKSSERRAKVIDELLANPSWADHWVSYWQDVLAENPGMLKPSLNNTGPFRWFLYDSFRDNKSMDRFITELVQMEGSLYSGGAAGFRMASENDVPMAAKAHIVSKAFLGMELGCARCHDAPFHPFKQEELFSLAAMLKRAPQKVPETSSIPTNANIKIGSVVKVTLPPGSIVKPTWPFANKSDGLPKDFLRNHTDTREELAALITDPRNERFPKVIVNRVWKQYLGWGLVEPVDDWPEKPEASHPELLDWLAREFVMSGYDLKHVAKLILNSHVYQRAAQSSSMQVPKVAERLFVGPARRRLTAEQLVDSLFAAVGKSLDPEELNQDADGRRPAQDFNNLGIPKRAWEFCSLANERDRPALALPRAQAIVDTLIMFGWRESRPNPLTVRDDSPNVLQPANLANSTLAVRVVRLSDDSALTRLALETRPLPELIRATFLRILSRPPTNDELAAFTSYLESGFVGRRLELVATAQKGPATKQAVSWSNHLNAEATKIKLEAERAARAGDPPTLALQSHWRERMEDMTWALVNSPEFIFVP
ncbi:MAG: DUF1553 domain-containing protein [Verrucomicrobiota bacterium]